MTTLDEIRAHYAEFKKCGVYWGPLLTDLAFLGGHY
jgi:hypothetical protein